MRYLSYIYYLFYLFILSIQNKTKYLDNSTRIVIKYNDNYNYFRFFFKLFIFIYNFFSLKFSLVHKGKEIIGFIILK